MRKIKRMEVIRGVYWVEIPDAELYMLCGCPEDATKHLMRLRLIVPREKDGVTFETGPNAVLLSDVALQNGKFCNLAEFPVLQMLYRQGMLIPGHPNNTGLKPMLIGAKDQIDAQMEYIYRANMTGQAQGSANQQTQNADDGVIEVVNRAQQQAQQLAKNLNQNDRVQVNVSVDDEGEALVSRPGSTLSNASSVAGAKSGGQANASQNAASNQAGNSHNLNPMAAAGQAQINSGQAQAQQTASASSQVQAAIQAGMDGKGVANAAQSGVHSGGSAGGGETAQTSSTTGNGQVQQGEKPDQAARAQSQNANRPTQMGQSVVEQVSVKITKALQSGSDRINVQLKPAEMGRVDVKMELTHDGRVMAVVTADNKDTLDLLRRDSSELQRALAEAGMDLDSGDLNFNLRGQENEMAEDSQGRGGLGESGEEVTGDDPEDQVDDGVMLAHEGGLLANGRIDVRA